MSARILLVPSVAKGNGSGHLMRCFGLAKALGPEAAVYIPEAKGETTWSAAELALSFPRELSEVEVVTNLRGRLRRDDDPERSELVVLDRRATSLDELLFWEGLGPVVAIDEGGQARSAAQYLIDVLPRAASARERGDPGPNRASLGFLELPKRRREPPREFRRILLSFGGEDPAGLSLGLARKLVGTGLADPSDLTLVSGALWRGAPPTGLDGVTVLGPVQDLKEHFARYDLVFTQFGLTAFEAAWAGCGVALLNPSKYHRALARSAGFAEVGVVEPDLGAIRRLLASPAELLARTAGILPEAPESLAGLLADLAPSGPRSCPVCSGSVRRAVYRDESKSYFRCGACGMLYLNRFVRGREHPYTKSYFFEEYRAQYGKTYLEDWPNLLGLAAPRLDLIEGLASKRMGRRKGLRLLDVGCAYGPFLAAAKERGMEPRGLDAAEEAAAYVRDELGIPAFAGDFLDPAVAASLGGPFDLVTMWYVIEHFEDLDRALRAVSALVRPGGLFAFSTPSGEGASAGFDRSGFFRASPADHYSVWEPSLSRGILGAYGFRVELIRITGHHPERLPLFRWTASRACPRSLAALGSSVGGIVSRLLGLGDTFEVYATRVSEPEGGTPVGEAGPLAPFRTRIGNGR